MTAREVIAALKEDGWSVVRKGPGSHLQFRHPTKRGTVTVPVHAGDIPLGTLKSIERVAGIPLRK